MAAIRYSDARTWKDNWEEICPGKSGGQGNSKVGRSKDGKTDRAFIKILNRQKDVERRARLYREVASLETLDVQGVPRLLETNARHYEDTQFDLYLVTEFVEGAELRDISSDYSPVDAIDWAVQLCDILTACHGAGIVHRDIKPENCMLSEDGKLHLVDFGLAFQAADEGFETPIGQELGNRFLRLPELSADSLNKADPRTDLTNCVGILFFLLTKRDPRVLADERGHPPHQRDPAADLLRKVGVPNLDRLLRVFDRGFDPQIDSRFQSAATLKEELEACLFKPESDTEAASASDRLQRKLDRPDQVRARVLMEKLWGIAAQIEGVMREISSRFPAVGFVGSSNSERYADQMLIYNAGLSYGQNNISLNFQYVIRYVGTEILLDVTVHGEAPFALRFPSEPGHLNQQQVEELRDFLISELEKSI